MQEHRVEKYRVQKLIKSLTVSNCKIPIHSTLQVLRMHILTHVFWFQACMKNWIRCNNEITSILSNLSILPTGFIFPQFTLHMAQTRANWTNVMHTHRSTYCITFGVAFIFEQSLEIGFFIYRLQHAVFSYSFNISTIVENHCHCCLLFQQTQPGNRWNPRSSEIQANNMYNNGCLWEIWHF